MPQQITPISIARLLLQHELFAFDSRTVTDLLGLDKMQTAHLLRRMERDGLIARIERGKYVMLGLTPEQAFSNPLFVGSHLVSPSYISFWSALHFHGFTDQAPRTVFVATSRQKREVLFRGMAFKFVRLKPEAFFGYRRETLAGLPVVIADRSKAILDSIALPEYAGGVSEVAKALHNAVTEGAVDITEMIEYARKLHKRSLSSRLGYLLEALGQPAEGLEPSSGPVRLDPQKPLQGTYHPYWKVYVNVPRQDLFPPGVA
ncbi:MAG: type IV toxin-antitoxin system AbiEi family antitoxin [Anaerolineales bacterium]|nr:type IV toxin-antitoxin system AbiEi family antitoxin [Anaerolineales bacterium]